MKATLEFNLPDDMNQFHMAVWSQDYFSALWDLRSLIREYEKYGEMDVDTLIDRAKDILYGVHLDAIS